jgi:hypothetical protein
MSEVRVDTIEPKTASGQMTMQDATIISGGLSTHLKDVGTNTVDSDEVAYTISGASITGTVTVAGILRIVR